MRSAKEIVFVGSGSEADNLAILGVARAARDRGRHVVSTAIEHHAVLHALDALRRRGVRDHVASGRRARTGRPGRFRTRAARRYGACERDVANNEIGACSRSPQLAAIARRSGVLFPHRRGASAGVVAHRRAEPGASICCRSRRTNFTARKASACCTCERASPFAPLVYGGGQEFGRRSGTENVAGIVGLARRSRKAVASQTERAERARALRDRLERGILASIEDVRINGAGASRMPNNLNVSFAGVDSESLLMRLDLEGVAVSAGSACTSGVLEPSHVIAALGIEPRWHEGVLRFSLGAGTSEQEIERVLVMLPGLVEAVRGNKGNARKLPPPEGVEL